MLKLCEQRLGKLNFLKPIEMRTHLVEKEQTRSENQGGLTINLRIKGKNFSNK
jgi:hypothetical protein